MPYCPKCGNTGILINGEMCDCRKTIHDIYSDVTCLEIPEQYRDIAFNEQLVPNLKDGLYAKTLNKLHNEWSTAVAFGKNYLICSPPRHSKTILAYATMKRLFRAGFPVFPVYDILELNKKIKLLDMGKPSDVDDEDLSLIIKAPMLFVKIPPLLDITVFQTGALILDRRVRHNNSTVFLYNGSWESLRRADKFEYFTPYAGDGSYCTFLVSNWKEYSSNES